MQTCKNWIKWKRIGIYTKKLGVHLNFCNILLLIFLNVLFLVHNELSRSECWVLQKWQNMCYDIYENGLLELLMCSCLALQGVAMCLCARESGEIEEYMTGGVCRIIIDMIIHKASNYHHKFLMKIWDTLFCKLWRINAKYVYTYL